MTTKSRQPAEVSLIIPTKNECGNIEPLVKRIEECVDGMPLEIVFVDDSTDATPEVIAQVSRRSRLPVSLIHRPPEQRSDGLGGAVVEGIRAAKGTWVCVMDGDLQHPPELLPEMLQSAAQSESEIVVASRYAESGDSDGLGFMRLVTSRICTLATRFLFPKRMRGIQDPLSGYFLLRRNAVQPDRLQPLGFKILLEILARFPRLRVSEVPFHFDHRQWGETKGTLREGVRFLRHLFKLRFGSMFERVSRFGIVGASGLIVNVALMAAFTEVVGVHYLVSAALATVGSTLWNFALTDAWVFRDRQRAEAGLTRLGQFFFMNAVALLLRSPLLLVLTTGLGVHYLASNVITLLALAVARYALADRWIWGETAGRPAPVTFNYDLHGIIRVQSEVRLPELAYFRTEKAIEEPDLRVRIGTARASANGAEPTNGAHPTYPTFRYRELFGRLGFWVNITPGPTMEVEAAALLRRSPHVLYTNVVEPILRWTLVTKGYALVHSAAVSAEGKALLITAPTDTGKTTTILRLLSRYPLSFLSDDMVIASADGRLRCYPKPLTISRHTLEAVDGARLSRWQRLALILQSRVHSKSGRRTALTMARLPLPMATVNTIAQMIVPPPKYFIGQLIADVDTRRESTLSQLVAIELGSDLRVELDPVLAKDTLLRNCEDAYGFPPYGALEGFLPTWNGEDLRAAEREIITSALGTCPATLLRREQRDWWQQLPGLLPSGGNGRTKPKSLRPPVRKRTPPITIEERLMLADTPPVDTGRTLSGP